MFKSTLCQIFALLVFAGYSQDRYTLTATVIDQNTKDKLPFATLSLKNPDSKAIIGGAVSDENGFVSLKSPIANVQIQVDYVGYETLVFEKSNISRKTALGTLGLTPKENQLAGIDLVGRRADVEIRLDKRVYNVGQNLNAKGTNVSDVLDNIPSLSIDIEGNLELRGNTNVRILIDGKPSGLIGLNGIDALADLPAESIERVEVITAPSARYQAEGTSGIVNIILAKNTLKGLNGVLNLTAGKFDSYGANASLNYKTGKFNFFTNSGYRDNTNVGENYQNNSYSANSNFDQFVETRKFDRRRIGTNVNVGFDYNLTEKTKFTLSYVQNERDGDDETLNDQNHFLASIPVTKSLRSEIEEDYDLNKQLSLSLTHKFNESGHKIDITLQRENNIENEFADLRTQQFVPQNSLGLLEENNTEEDQKQFLAQLDYVFPIDKNTQFEAGYRTTNEKQNSGFVVQQEDVDGVMVIDDYLTNYLDFKQEVHALYTQFGKKWGAFSLLSGLRYEHTSLAVVQKTTNEDGNSSFGDFFPTLNLGIELSETANITIGYNRRISRPRSRELNPFQSRSSETSFFQGNPYVKPSYSNGFDIGYLKQLKKITINSSVYFRRTDRPISRISIETGDFATVNGEVIPVIKRFPVNLGRTDQLGIEANSSVRWSTKWRSNLSFNLFRRVETGTYEDDSFNNENESWTGNLRNNLTLLGNINTQINMFFRGASRSAFGKRKSFGGVNLGLSKDLFKENATLNLNFSDVFNSQIFRWESFTENIITNGKYQRRKPFYKVTFTYRFRQDKERQRRGGGDDYGDGGGYEL
ncbi:MAG: Vitamin B12 transporter BtuB [Bacteroidota bacterium]|nr:MAG: Vitamin B12 transporter BtuB [Bacteroidota bacterium]